MVKPVSTHYNSPKLTTYGEYDIGTIATECETDFGPTKRMYGDLYMLMEITASTAFRARNTVWSSTSHLQIGHQDGLTMSYLCWGSQSWTQYYRWDTTTAEQRGRVIFFDHDCWLRIFQCSIGCSCLSGLQACIANSSHSPCAAHTEPYLLWFQQVC